MNSRNLAVPLLAFAGGAILGRLFGLKTLARGAMTAAAVTGMASQPALLETGRKLTRAATRTSPRRRSAPARKRVAPKKSRAS